MNTLRILTAICALALLAVNPSIAESDFSKRVRIATLNAGWYTNEYADQGRGIDLKETGPFYGAYAQWIETGKFQANLFGYLAPDVNDARVAGLHANADAYFLGNALGTFAAGVDGERISVDMDAGNSIAGLENFEMRDDVTVAIARAGFRFAAAPSSKLRATIFPYGGYAWERDDGTLTVNPAGPPEYTPEMRIDLDDALHYPVWGVNLAVRAFYAIELTGKYLAQYRDGDVLASATAQVNVFLPWNLVASYQYKYMERLESADSYHMLGVGTAF
jgi:hypothetical protein